MVFALFNVVWSTLFLEEWKRRGAELAYKWGTLDSPGEAVEEPRPQFRVSTGMLSPRTLKNAGGGREQRQELKPSCSITKGVPRGGALQSQRRGVGNWI